MISDRGEGPSIFLFDVVRSSFTVFRHNGMEWNGTKVRELFSSLKRRYTYTHALCIY